MKQLKVKVTKGPIPFRGYIMNFFGTILTRKPLKLSAKHMNHEGIHWHQQMDFVFGYEKLYILGACIFYILYGLEYLVKTVCKLFYWPIRSYRSVSFEQEAYLNDKNLQYQDTRKRFAWLKYIFKIYRNVR